MCTLVILVIFGREVPMHAKKLSGRVLLANVYMLTGLKVRTTPVGEGERQDKRITMGSNGARSCSY